MLLKYMKHEIKALMKVKYTFAQPPKKRTQAPRYTRQKPQHKIDPRNIDYSKVPEDIRKGVKAYVQATNMLVTSQAELETMALREIILEQRDKMKTTLDQMGQTPAKNPQPAATIAQAEIKTKVEENYYDLMKALKFTSNVSGILMAGNMLGYFLLTGIKKYGYLGFFLGMSMNPSMITLTGLAIGFNAASWIIIQSLHLSIRDPSQLTPKTISLTNCSPLMHLQALSIVVQISLLSHYLMQPVPFQSMHFLLGSYTLSSLHMVYSVLRATGGYKFDYFAKMMITQITGALLIGTLTYSLFGKINSVQELDGLENFSVGQMQAMTTDESILLKKGYQTFLSEFKEQKIAIVKGEAINQIISEEEK